jgi:hypothetical protein
MNLLITPDAALSIARYTDAYEAMELADELKGPAREEIRSYACEALVRILRANPEAFDFVARMEAVRARKVGGRV